LPTELTSLRCENTVVSERDRDTSVDEIEP